MVETVAYALMKIALVSDWFLPRVGGLELHMRDLARELQRCGHVVHVITVTPGASNVDGVPVHRLDLPLVPSLQTIWGPRSVSTMRALVESERYDLIHGQSAFSPLAQVAMYVGRQLSVPTVLTEQSVLKGAGAVILSLAERLLRWSAWPDVITAVSTFVAGELERVIAQPVPVLPNGVRLAEWASKHDQTRELRVTSVMRLTPRKRPLDVVRAMPRVYERIGPSLRPRFTLIGDGPLRARVELEAKRLGVRDDLDLMGWQPRHEVRKQLERSSVFALPTRKEALSIATMEALACGLPVVAMGLGGVGDIVRHGREGFLARDDDQFVEAIAQLVVDEQLRRRMASQTRHAAARFAWDRVVQQHFDVYELARQRRGAVRLLAS
jgi:glycosyltransferase involved in cell wall biosynthesis